MVVSSARVKMFVEKHEVCMVIMTPEDETTTLSQNNGHQSLNDLPPHPRLQLHHCKSIKTHTISHSNTPVTTKESEKVLKNVVL